MALAGILEIQLMADIARLSTDLKRAEQQVHASTDKMGRSVATLESAFGKLGSTLMLGAAFEGVRRLTDDYTKLTAQIRIATHGQAEYANGLAEVRRISTESQASITATGALYTRLTNSLGAYGATQKQVANITETVSLGLKAYGATSVEASSAMLQLSQAFASNRLGGDEFRAMMESMPNMMRTLAKSMNVPFEALKVLSAEGKITAKEMMKAWDDPALIASLQKQANMTRTITGEITVLRNNLMMLVGEFMGASGSTAGITTALRAMSDSVLFLGKNLSQVITLITVYVGYLALMGAQSVIEWSKARLVTVAHTQALVADAIGKKAHAAIMTATAEQVVAAKLEEAFASQAAFRATLAETQALLAGTLAANERAAAELRLAGMTDRVTAAHAEAIVMERERTITMVASNAAEGGRTAALAASSAGAIRWGTSVSAAMAMIGTSVSAAVLANPIGLAVVAIGAITLAIVEWETVVKASKATFNWFSETIDALVFGAKAWSISLGEVFALIEVGFLKDTGQITLEQSRAMRAQIKADAEQSTIDLINLGHEKIDHEKLAAMERYANDRKEWEKLTNTKEQRRQTEIESLKEHYRALVKGQVLNKEQILANEERYAQGLAIINEKYGKDAVRAAKARAKELSEEEKARAKFEMEVSDARQKYADDLNRETKSIEQKTAAVLLETESIGKTKAEIDMLQASRYDHETQLMRETLATYESAVACTVEAEALKEAIKARETYKKAQTDQSAVHARQAAIEAESKAVKKLADEERKANEKLWRDIDGFAHTAFDNIFDKGKNVFEELGKVIQKSILDMLYQMTVKKWIINIQANGSSTGGISNAGSLFSTGGGMGGAGSLLSTGSNLYSGLGSLFATGGGMASMAGSTAVMSSSYAAPAIATAAGEAAGAGAASGAMAAVSTAMPYLAAAYAVYTLATQDHGTPTSNTGNAAMQFNPAGGMTGMQTFYGGTTANTNATITGMQTAYLQAAMNLGIGTVATQFRYGGNTGENGQHPNFALGGGAGRSSFYQSETTLSDAAVQLAASRAVFAALQGSQLPQYLKSVFEGVSIGTMSQAQIDNTLAYAQSLKQLRDSLLETRTPLEIAQAQVMDLTGALHTSTDAFKNDFVAAIDAGINQQTFNKWQSLGTAIDQVTKATAPLALNLQSSTNYFASKLEYDRLMGRIGSKSVAAPTSNAELVTELKAMRAELASLRTSSEATASSTRKTTDLLRNVTRDGNSLITTPA